MFGFQILDFRLKIEAWILGLYFRFRLQVLDFGFGFEAWGTGVWGTGGIPLEGGRGNPFGPPAAPGL